jgi:hypothetical protein
MPERLSLEKNNAKGPKEKNTAKDPTLPPSRQVIASAM